MGGEPAVYLQVARDAYLRVSWRVIPDLPLDSTSSTRNDPSKERAWIDADVHRRSATETDVFRLGRSIETYVSMRCKVLDCQGNSPTFLPSVRWASSPRKLRRNRFRQLAGPRLDGQIDLSIDRLFYGNDERHTRANHARSRFASALVLDQMLKNRVPDYFIRERTSAISPQSARFPTLDSHVIFISGVVDGALQHQFPIIMTHERSVTSVHGAVLKYVVKHKNQIKKTNTPIFVCHFWNLRDETDRSSKVNRHI